MPLYEYECRQCGATTDVRHGFDETVTTPCPACGGELGRRFSPAGHILRRPVITTNDTDLAGRSIRCH